MPAQNAFTQQTFAQQKLMQLNVEGYASLVDAFDQCCAEFAAKPAFHCLGQTLSYQDIEAYSRQFAAFLSGACGLQRGDRIAIQLPNLNQFPIVVWGALRIGLTVVNTNPMYTATEQLHQFNDSGAKALVVLSELLAVTEQVVPNTGIETVISTHAMDMLQAQPAPQSSLPNLVSLPDALALGVDLSMPAVSMSMDDLAVLQYTGGTTGPAKGAMLSHGNVFAGMRMSKLSFVVDSDEDDILIAPMPLYHVFGFTMNVVGGFVAGGLSVLVPDPRDADGLIALMRQFKFTAMASVNTLLQGLMMHPDFDQIDFSKVRGIIAGGTALVKEIADEWDERTGSEIFEGYGLSETTAVLTCNNPENRRLGTVGVAMVAQEIKLVDDAGARVEHDQRGEICVRGAQVMQGYWQRPEATAEAIDADGWFRTGDVGVMSADGFVSIVDRIKDMVLVSGFNVYPNEIEDVVYSHPDIIECAVVGMKDDKTGEAVKLFVVSTNPSLTEDTIKEYCRQYLTAYKVPKTVVFSDDLPKSPVGKILRRELRA
ncbi:MAG: AMP-binding protein [Porticoccaceae bacterium]|nr:AMP-binding protein [Porticoccaceae bacterium]